MNYRKEIDGLRALAVLPIIFFHAGFKVFSGGFVGVDIFFVISGFLITSNILTELNKNQFSLARFYTRRAKRILPALFFVLLTSLIFAWAWLLPADISDYSKSLIAVSIFASNILFWRETGYFDVAAELKPLLHTWSLSVEEQFYIFFPLLLIFVWRFGKRYTLIVLGVLFFFSLVIAQWASLAIPSAAFFLMPTRMWEFLVGSFAAFYLPHYTHAGFNKKINGVFAWLGLILICYSVFAFNKTTPLPGIYALVPTVGALLIIVFCNEHNIVGKLLGSKAFVGIGLISYSAYLWHQPIFAFTRHRSLNEPSPLLLTFMCLITFLLAYLSWRFIEKPFRFGHIFSSKKFILSVSIFTIFFLIVGNYGYRIGRDAFTLTWVEGGSMPKKFSGIVKDGVDCSFRDPAQSCRIGREGSNLRIVLAGDSHARVLTEAAEYFSRSNDFELIDLSASGCPFLLGMSAYVNGAIDDKCNDTYQLKRLRFLSTMPSSVVVMHSRIPLYISGRGFNNTVGGIEYRDGYVIASTANTSPDMRKIQHSEAYERTVKALLDLGHKVLIVEPVPTNGWNPIMRLKKIDQYGLAANHESRFNLMKIPLSAVDEELGPSEAIIRETKQKFPGIGVIDPKLVFCDSIYCSSITNDKILYSDSNHLSFDGASKLFEQILIEINRLK
jgi:peptidoglycan/LPS O-acetylase OafA/YrhL